MVHLLVVNLANWPNHFIKIQKISCGLGKGKKNEHHLVSSLTVTAEQREVRVGGIVIRGVVVQTFRADSRAAHLHRRTKKKNWDLGKLIPTHFTGTNLWATHSSVPALPVFGYVQVRVNVGQVPLERLALQPLSELKAF